VALGIVLFALHLLEGPEEYTALLVIGSVFLAGYFYRRAYGLLIPGCILLGIGLGLAADDLRLPLDDPEPVGIGVGFLLIFLIDTVVRGQSRWWPLIPGLILVIIGVGPDVPDPGRIVSIGWPLALVIVGVILIVRAGRGKDEKPREPGDDRSHEDL